jgi:hypothetical protein
MVMTMKEKKSLITNIHEPVCCFTQISLNINYIAGNKR